MRTSMKALVAIAAMAISGPALASVYTPDTSVTYNAIGRDFTITDNGPSTVYVNPGEQFTLTGNWSIGSVDTSNCPNCIIQLYLAGMSPLNGQANLYSGEIYSNNQASGNYMLTLTAPTATGNYFAGGAYTLDYQYDTVSGGPNSAGDVNYQVNVPEPGSLALLGIGLLGLGVVARPRKRRPA